MLIQVMAFAFVLISPPLQLEWNKSHNHPPEIEDHRYFYGDTNWGTAVYVGREDILGLETEIQLDFKNKKIAKALLILGPAGIDSTNCKEKYRKVISVLNEKYGTFKKQVVEKDTLIRDLLYVDSCRPVQVGLYTIDTYWISGDYLICASLFGDEEIYIEISYIKKSVKLTPRSRKKALQRL